MLAIIKAVIWPTTSFFGHSSIVQNKNSLNSKPILLYSGSYKIKSPKCKRENYLQFMKGDKIFFKRKTNSNHVKKEKNPQRKMEISSKID